MWRAWCHRQNIIPETKSAYRIGSMVLAIAFVHVSSHKGFLHVLTPQELVRRNKLRSGIQLMHVQQPPRHGAQVPASRPCSIPSIACCRARCPTAVLSLHGQAVTGQAGCGKHRADEKLSSSKMMSAASCGPRSSLG